MIRAIVAGSSLIALAAFAAEGSDRLAGVPPSMLLKQDAPFADAYRAAVRDQDLPAWTERLSVGFPAEKVTLDGRDLLLTSACNPDSGCHDERLYLLYDPASRSMTAFFFLPPHLDTPGDHRMAFSRWLGARPSEARSTFLLNRALEDAEKPEDNLPSPANAKAAH